MKRFTKTKIGVTATIIFVVLSLYFCWASVHAIDIFRPRHITMTSSSGPTLTKAQEAKFTFLLNTATNKGTFLGYDTHPEYQFVVNYGNGETLEIYEYDNCNFGVSYCDRQQRHITHYVHSQMLHNYAQELMNQQYGDDWPDACGH